jgi:YbbR domain-containing protein
MAMRLMQRAWKNVNTVLLSLALAVAVWISAVVASDPNEECAEPKTAALELQGKVDELLVIGSLPQEVSVKMQAPASICRELESQPELVRAILDLSGVQSGQHELPVEVVLDTQPVRVLEVLPREVEIVLETIARVEKSVVVMVEGQPARGFQLETALVDQRLVEVSGPQSLVDQVSDVWAVIEVSGAQTTVSAQVELKAVDEDGQQVANVEISPGEARVTQGIVQSGGFRTVAVRVETIGQPGLGYRLTTIEVSPPTVTISSADPQQLDELPGFVSTQLLDLTELTDDEEFRLSLDLPLGVFVEGEQTVLVFVGIRAIEGTTVMTVPVEFIGLTAGLDAQFSPEFVEVFLTGPVAILNELGEDDVRVFVDLTEFTSVGTYLVEVKVEILPDRIEVESKNPQTVEVTLVVELTPRAVPTDTPTPGP